MVGTGSGQSQLGTVDLIENSICFGREFKSTSIHL